MSPPTLPQELLDMIFALLSDHRHSLAACSLVHRSWTFPAHRVLFQSLTVNMSGKTSDQIVQFISPDRARSAIPATSHVCHLTVKTGSLMFQDEVSVSTIADMADSMPRLKTLAIIWATLSPPADVRRAPRRTLDCLTLCEVGSQVSAENVIKAFVARFNVRSFYVKAASFNNLTSPPAPSLDGYLACVQHFVVHSNSQTRSFFESFAKGPVRSLEIRLQPLEECADLLCSLATAGTVVERLLLDVSDCLPKITLGTLDDSRTFRHLRDCKGVTAATIRVQYLVERWDRHAFNAVALRLITLFLTSAPPTAQFLTVVLAVVPSAVPEPHALLDAFANALARHLDALRRNRPALKMLRWVWDVVGAQTVQQKEASAEFEGLFQTVMAALCHTLCAKGIVKFGDEGSVASR
ncbi:hypothetical protein PsYK624_137740 [Phanerochaete sordida]|uniref:F-box domain-containing protein n=1 Tax=Phanerochaete sordida TaxID=48140 RepID=A0A9P3GMA0_9APHY|nr:hypothetical protein PsYK624_137740 [Phanerochaete sordida]